MSWLRRLVRWAKSRRIYLVVYEDGHHAHGGKFYRKEHADAMSAVLNQTAPIPTHVIRTREYA